MALKMKVGGIFVYVHPFDDFPLKYDICVLTRIESRIRLISG